MHVEATDLYTISADADTDADAFYGYTKLSQSHILAKSAQSPMIFALTPSIGIYLKAACTRESSLHGAFSFIRSLTSLAGLEIADESDEMLARVFSIISSTTSRPNNASGACSIRPRMVRLLICVGGSGVVKKELYVRCRATGSVHSRCHAEPNEI